MPSCATRSRLIAPELASAATLAVSTSSISASLPERKSLSAWWFTDTPPQIQRYASCSRTSRAISRPLPTPSSVAYSHSANRMRGSIAARPALLPRALIASSSRLKSCCST